MTNTREIYDIDKFIKVIKSNPTTFISLILFSFFMAFGAFYYFVMPAKNAQIELLEAKLRDAQNRPTNAEIEAMKTQIEAKDAQIRNKNAQIETKDAQINLLREKIGILEGTLKESEVGKVREKLRAKYVTDFWTVDRLPNKELIEGFKGNYYVIDIKDADLKELIKFKKGEYTIDDFDAKFIKNLSDFTEKIIRVLHGRVQYKIFVKGSADRLGHDTFQRKFEPNFEYNEIIFYRRLTPGSKSKFVPIPEIEKIHEPIRNTNLPNLRAEFIRRKLNDAYSDIDSPTILDGNVELQIGAEHRNATLLLFVKWPIRKNYTETEVK